MTFNPFVSFTNLTNEEIDEKMQEIGNKIIGVRRFPNMRYMQDQLEEIYNQLVDLRNERTMQRNLPPEGQVDIIELGIIEDITPINKKEEDDDQ